jgi:hypothetical protein
MDVDDDLHLNNNVDLMEDVDIVQVVIDLFTEAVLDTDSDHYGMAHYINDHPIIIYWFNELLGVLFEMELPPSMKSLVTEVYVVRAIIYDQNYSFAKIISSG